MAINPFDILKLKGEWDAFKVAHPKLLPYFREVYKNYLGTGTVMEITFTDAEGKSLKCNMKLSDADMEMMKRIRDVLSGPSETQ